VSGGEYGVMQLLQLICDALNSGVNRKCSDNKYSDATTRAVAMMRRASAQQLHWTDAEQGFPLSSL
jgi:hypothetical protein